MEVIIVLLIVAILNGAIALIDQMLDSLVPMTLYADQYMTNTTGGSMVDVLFQILLGVGVSLIILKFLKKGFECYVLWTDGDPDADPTNLVIRFMQAMVVAVSFPVLYGWLAEIVQNLTDQLLAAISGSTNYNWQAWVDGISTLGIVTAIFGLVFVICYFLLYFQFLMRGLELMILRVGIPVACVGLIDNDKGVFKSYMNKFFQTALAVIVQICLCKLGVGMMLNMHIFWGIACMILAIKTPKFLSEFLVPTGDGGSGVINNAYHSVRLIQMIKKIKQRSGDDMITIDDISMAVIALLRLGAAFRFIYCMIRLQSAEDEAAQFKKRARNTVIFYIIAECVWQLKEIIFYYYV